MNLTRNPKILIGITIQCVDFLFMLSVWLTVDRVPSFISFVHLACILTAGTLMILGLKENLKERKTTTHKSQPSSSESR